MTELETIIKAGESALENARASDINAEVWRQRAIQSGWKPIHEWENWEAPVMSMIDKSIINFVKGIS